MFVSLLLHAMPATEIGPAAYFTVREFSDGSRALDAGGTLPTFRGSISSNVSIFEDKTFMEFDLGGVQSPFRRAELVFMTTGGTVAPRTVEIGWYGADGAASTGDFDIVPDFVSTFTRDQAIPELFEMNVTAAVTAALQQFAFIGFVFEMQTSGRQTFLSESPILLRIIAVDEPATAWLVLGMMAVLLGTRGPGHRRDAGQTTNFAGVPGCAGARAGQEARSAFS
jgi:hypothetical protein